MSQPRLEAERDAARWIVGPEGDALMAELATHCDRDGVAAAPVLMRLRKRYSQDHIRIAQSQLRLREKAVGKFGAAARKMFFTSTGLEQSSSAAIALYKTHRFQGRSRLADLCCGVGGDLQQLARIGPAVGVDLDPVIAEFARANVANGDCGEVEVVCEDAAEFAVGEVDAWHMDPDRRADGRRTTRVDAFAPTWNAIEALLRKNPNAALKLAPATELPDPERWHREWIGDSRQCSQQVVWRGDLATASEKGLHRATVLRADASISDGSVGADEADQHWSLAGQPDMPIESAAEIGEFLFDPAPSVLAAGLLGALAHELSLQSVAPGAAYLTANTPCNTPAVQCFQVVHASPLDRKRWRRTIREREIGRLTIKKRGVDIAPETLRKQLQPTGSKSATLLVVRRGEQVLGVLAEPWDNG